MEHGSEPAMLTVEAFPVGALNPYHRNPRRGVVKAIADSLRVRGQYRPIVVNVGTHTGRPLEVLAGNHTLQAAASIGWERIEATTVDVDDEGAAQIVLADNRLADLGSYDDESLLEVLRSAGDLEGTGYDETDVAALLRELEEPASLSDPDDVPDVPEEPRSQAGFLWELGPHRLLVGDSTDPSAVRAAVGETVVDCLWTDPPYGVDYVGKTADALTIQNDGASGLGALLADAFTAADGVLSEGAAVYVCHAPGPLSLDVADAVRGAGWTLRQQLIWVKNVMVLGHSDYHYRHEPIWFAYTAGGGRRGRGGAGWFGDNSETSLFEVAKPTRSDSHPTTKPVELVERMIRNSCPAGGTVLDLFGGSGSTLIAAHRAGLKSVLVELDPRYADVICKRWQEHTGVVPLLDGQPVSFL